ncbi:SH3 domain-containing protein [Lachnospiraceae bacterium XBD2001]|nr:SH3 domain-containing protein [Lachnospiraceae bacterium XBD2001]
MKKSILVIMCLLLASSVIGCGSKKDAINDAVIDETEEATQTDDDASLSYLLNNCTSIDVKYGYQVETQGASGNYYQIMLRDGVTKFESMVFQDGDYEERASDYTAAKFEELRDSLKAAKPKLYDINEHADENGKIIYETLDPAIIVYGKASDNGATETYLLDIDDTSKIEALITALYDTSDVIKPITESNVEVKNTEVVPGTPGTDSDEGNQSLPSGAYTMTLSSTVNVRSTMSETASKVAVAYAGEEITVLMKYNEGWTKVLYLGKEGYVKTEFLK